MEIALPPFMAKIKAEQEKSRLIRKGDVPVTQKMLFGVRDELKADLASVRSELKGEIESNTLSLESLIYKLTSEVHRLGVLIEEQNARNTIVLDGLASLYLLLKF